MAKRKPFHPLKRGVLIGWAAGITGGWVFAFESEMQGFIGPAVMVVPVLVGAVCLVLYALVDYGLEELRVSLAARSGLWIALTAALLADIILTAVDLTPEVHALVLVVVFALSAISGWGWIHHSPPAMIKAYGPPPRLVPYDALSHPIRFSYRLTQDELLCALRNAQALYDAERAGFVIHVLPWSLQKGLYKASLRGRADVDRTVDYLINTGGVSSNVHGLTEGHYEWGGVVKAARTKDGFLLFTVSAQQFSWIPLHALAPEDAEMLAAFLQITVKKYVELA